MKTYAILESSLDGRDLGYVRSCVGSSDFGVAQARKFNTIADAESHLQSNEILAARSLFGALAIDHHSVVHGVVEVAQETMDAAEVEARARWESRE